MTKFKDLHGVEAFWAPKNHIAESWKDLVLFLLELVCLGAMCFKHTTVYT